MILTCLFFVALLHVSNPDSFAAAIKMVLLAHVPIVFIEAVVVGAAAGFIHRVRPDLLGPPTEKCPKKGFLQVGTKPGGGRNGDVLRRS